MIIIFCVGMVVNLQSYIVLLNIEADLLITFFSLMHFPGKVEYIREFSGSHINLRNLSSAYYVPSACKIRLHPMQLLIFHLF